jgi:hypothetical protein
MAAGLARGRLDGGETADGWRLQADLYFGDVGRIGLLVAGGRELEAATGGPISTRVDSVVLMARWGLAAGWLLDASAGRTQVSGIVRHAAGGEQQLPGGYNRDGVSLGVQYRF